MVKTQIVPNLKIKIISDQLYDIESELNDFLESKQFSEIVDIKFSTCVSDNKPAEYSVLITYISNDKVTDNNGVTDSWENFKDNDGG